MTAPSAIRARRLEKSFKDGEARTPVLRHVDLDVATGEMTFLIGPSGCGKTTLISLIAGILRPDGGEVEIFGTRLGALSAKALAAFRAQTIGFIFQQFNLIPTLTAVENASIPLLIGGAPAATAERRAADMLDRLGLSTHLDKLPSQLSGGNSSVSPSRAR